MERVTSASFVNTENLVRIKEEKSVDLDLFKVCDEIEANQKSHLFDPTYDDELYKICAMVEKNSQRSSSLPSYEIQTGSRELPRKRSAEASDESTTKRSRNKEATQTSSIVYKNENLPTRPQFTTHVEIASVSPESETIQRSIPNDEQPSYDILEVEKRVKLDNSEDDLKSFGKYVKSSLRTLSAKNCVHAQDEIQSILSKYKIRNLNKRRNSTPKPES